MLKQRGTLIGSGKSCKKLEKEILQKVVDDSVKITTPVRAFITFRTQEGFERCSKYMGKSKTKPVMKLFDYPVTFRAAPEPSNVIWENLEVTGPTMKKRQCISYLWIGAFILVCFLLITILKVQSGTTKAKYPVRVECSEITNEFTSLYKCDDTS